MITEIRKMDWSKKKLLITKGGGSKIYAHCGALKGLDKLGIYSQFEGFAGTSAGAIIAGLCALGYTPDEINTIVNSYNLASFKDNSLRSEMLAIHDYGYCRGEVFLNAMKKAVKDKTGNELSTFADMHNGGLKQLKVYASQIDQLKIIKEFSFELTPNVPVAFAIRASMSIPAIFESFEIDGQLYVDGGLVNNYPISAFDSQCQCADDETVGFYLFDKYSDLLPPKKLNKGAPFYYIKLIFEAAINTQDAEFQTNYANQKRSVQIDTFGFSATNFNLSVDQRVQLYKSGLNSVLNA